MKFKKYAQINEAGECVATLETSGEIEAPHMIEVDDDEIKIGQVWNGKKWTKPKPKAEDVARQELDEIDRETGMNRNMRRLLLAIADKVGADTSFLKDQEDRAEKARAKLKG
jgi:hypothetical protein